MKEWTGEEGLQSLKIHQYSLEILMALLSLMVYSNVNTFLKLSSGEETSLACL